MSALNHLQSTLKFKSRLLNSGYTLNEACPVHLKRISLLFVFIVYFCINEGANFTWSFHLIGQCEPVF